jgi:hypothetical protein
MSEAEAALIAFLDRSEDISRFLTTMIEDRRITGELDKRRIVAFQEALARLKDTL